MKNHLFRDRAPITEAGWEEIEKEAKRTTIRLRDQALSTSGDYENFFEIEGRWYSHILNPRSGVPVQGMASCTVTAASCLESDAYATAFFVLGIQKSLDRFGGRLGIRFVDTDVNIRQTERFP